MHTRRETKRLEDSGQFDVESSETTNITRTLAEAGNKYRFEEIPSEAVTVAKQCFLDWLGVTLAGSRESVTHILREEMLEQGGASHATLIGSGEKVTTQQAAMINGTASHALDFDDVHSAMAGHPSVPVLPALLALAEQEGLSGRDFISAFVSGFEIECRVGLLMGPGHYQAGWHATGTVGTFGAVAACAHALGLDLEQWLVAFGIAGTQAAGLKSMFGTMSKPLHAGKAASNGLLAASLASRGFTANPAILDTHQGFGSTQTTTFSPEKALLDLGETFHIWDVLFKHHAACFFTHSSIEGLLLLKGRHALTPERVRSVVLRVPSNHLSTCNILEPKTPLEAKFSLRFVAALALVGDDTSNSAFTEESVGDSALVSVRDRITVESVDGLASVHASEVVVTLMDGTVLSESVDMEKPEKDLEHQWHRLIGKFRGLATPAILSEPRTDSLIEAISGLEDITDMAEVATLCTPAK